MNTDGVHEQMLSVLNVKRPFVYLTFSGSRVGVNLQIELSQMIVNSIKMVKINLSALCVNFIFKISL